MSDTLTSAAPLARLLAKAERCQYEQSPVSRLLPLRWVRAARIWARRRWRDTAAAPAELGPPSRFSVGDWVRVRDAEDIRATLDAQDKLRGLLFMPGQWAYCGNTYRVARVVRRMIDDSLQMRKISQAVILAGVTCDGPHGEPGCGAACALLFKDDWLEPASTPSAVASRGDERANRDPHRPPARSASRSFAEQERQGQFARVRSAAEILRTLGWDGRLNGVSPSQQMLALAGQRFRVARQREYRQPRNSLQSRLAKEWYILDGVRCNGQVLGSAGPCHRSCGLVWHESWLEFD